MEVKQLPNTLAEAALKFCNENLQFTLKLSIHGSITVVTDIETSVGFFSKKIPETQSAQAKSEGSDADILSSEVSENAALQGKEGEKPSRRESTSDYPLITIPTFSTLENKVREGSEKFPEALSNAVCDFCEKNLRYVGNVSVHGIFTVIADSETFIVFLSKDLTVNVKNEGEGESSATQHIVPFLYQGKGEALNTEILSEQALSRASNAHVLGEDLHSSYSTAGGLQRLVDAQSSSRDILSAAAGSSHGADQEISSSLSEARKSSIVSYVSSMAPSTQADMLNVKNGLLLPPTSKLVTESHSYGLESQNTPANELSVNTKVVSNVQPHEMYYKKADSHLLPRMSLPSSVSVDLSSDAGNGLLSAPLETAEFGSKARLGEIQQALMRGHTTEGYAGEAANLSTIREAWMEADPLRSSLKADGTHEKGAQAVSSPARTSTTAGKFRGNPVPTVGGERFSHTDTSLSHGIKVENSLLPSTAPIVALVSSEEEMLRGIPKATGFSLAFGGEQGIQPGSSYSRMSQNKTAEFHCNQCDKVFAWKNHLVEHIKMHTGEKPFSCEHCFKGFSSRADLTKHTRIHTGAKHCCTYCGKGFLRKTDLVRHVRIHTGEKPYSCEHCGKRFARGADLVRHVRIHTGEKPYSCEHCGKGFAQSNDLLRHVRIHTGGHTCNLCGQVFGQKRTWIDHMRMHRGFPTGIVT